MIDREAVIETLASAHRTDRGGLVAVSLFFAGVAVAEEKP